MTKHASCAARLILCPILLLAAWLALPVTAGAADPNLREADRHFQHGVALYVEADYRGALVEFNRAYVLAPNGIVLFNIAETQYQLRDYAAALASFEHFLAETAQNDPHRPLAETNLRELRTRVGRLRITTVPVGAEISIDDKVIGKTPFAEPVIVGIGHMLVRASAPGRPPVARAVEVAAEDDVAVTLELLPMVSTSVRTQEASSSAPTITLTERAPPAAPKDYSSWRTAGWVLTGLLAGGAITFGVLAYNASSDLQNARDAFPAKPTTIKHFSDNTVKFSTVADSLGVATLVIGGITLYSTLIAHNDAAPAASVAVGPGSLRLTF
jgi:tetratricopeptide (TPR) repeat protein